MMGGVGLCLSLTGFQFPLDIVHSHSCGRVKRLELHYLHTEPFKVLPVECCDDHSVLRVGVGLKLHQLHRQVHEMLVIQRCQH
jgi:hypothetical protein